MYNDAIKAPTAKLPDYLRWKMPLTGEQLEAWQETGIAIVAREGLPAHPGPLLIYWSDQRSRRTGEIRRYRARQRAAGLCRECPSPLGPSSDVRCEYHHQHQLAYQRLRRLRGWQ